MRSEIYWIQEEVTAPGKLGTMARPRGRDWLKDEIKWLKLRTVDIFVSLLEYTESCELGLQEEEDLCRAQGIDFYNFPIQDVHIPHNENKFVQLILSLSLAIDEGKTVVVHCRMGIGRASMVAAGILMHKGLSVDDAFKVISKYRKLSVPDTKEQHEWMKTIQNKLSEL